jgi:hypothetical protein
MKKGIVFNTGSYFEWHIKIVGAAFILIGIVWISQNVIGGLLLITAGVTTFATNYHFMIDHQRKIYRDGVTILGVNFGSKIRYQSVEYLFVKAQKISRTYNSRIRSTTVAGTEYNGYIRFTEKEKVNLFSAHHKDDVVKKLTQLSNVLKVQIVDYTGEVSDVI